MEIKEKLIAAKTALISSSPFFGRLVTLFQIKELKDYPYIAATDGEFFYYNPKLAGELTVRQLHFVMAHEVMHCALGHIWRVEDRDRFRWNCAADYVINLILEDNGFEVIDGCLLDNKFRNMSTEQVYELLPQQKTLKIKMANSGWGQNEIPNQDSDKNPTKNHDKWGKKNKDGDGKPEKDKKDGDKGEQEKKEAGGDGKKDKQQQKWEDAVGGKFGNKKSPQQKMWEAAMSGALSAAKERGEIPGGLERMFEEMRPRENWKEILMMYMSASNSDFDFMQRDRRSSYSEFFLPDLKSEDDLENIVVAIDTSGSITNTELNSFVAESKAIIDSFPHTKGWLIDCDAEVKSVVPIEDAVKKTSFYGGGGTSHVPVFEEIKRRQWNPKVVICFTDLFTEYPAVSPPYPVLWLTLPNSSSNKPPFGRVIKMKDLD